MHMTLRAKIIKKKTSFGIDSFNFQMNIDVSFAFYLYTVETLN